MPPKLRGKTSEHSDCGQWPDLDNLDALVSEHLPSMAALKRRFPNLPNIALSIRQPWAFFIVHGFKNIENRTWQTSHRGPILIHAGGTRAKLYLEDDEELFIPAIGRGYPDALDDTHAPRGGIVGMADLVDCVTEHPSPWFEKGGFGFVLENAHPLPFVAIHGKLNVFRVA
jgi:hypothetical protein